MFIIPWCRSVAKTTENVQREQDDSQPWGKLHVKHNHGRLSWSSTVITPLMTQYMIRWTHGRTPCTTVPAGGFVFICCSSWPLMTLCSRCLSRTFKDPLPCSSPAHLCLIPAGRLTEPMHAETPPLRSERSPVRSACLITSSASPNEDLRPPSPLVSAPEDARRMQHSQKISFSYTLTTLRRDEKKEEEGGRGERERRRKLIITHLVKQKDAWIGQGHPQITGGGISVTSAQLGWGGEKKGSHSFSAGHQLQAEEHRASSRHSHNTRGDESSLHVDLRRHLRCEKQTLPSSLWVLTPWSMTVHKAMRTDTQMDRLQLS